MSELLDILDRNFPKYDIVFKSLFVVHHSMLREMLNIPCGRELPLGLGGFGQTEVDALVLSDESIFHVEFQSWNDARMQYRMLDYFNSILQNSEYCDSKEGVSIRQSVLYVGYPAMNMTSHILQPGMDYRYDLSDVREYGREWSERLSASPRPLDWILSFVCRPSPPDEQQWIGLAARILAYSQHRTRRHRLPLPAVLLIAATLRRISRTTRLDIINMFRMKLDDPLFKDIYDQAVERTRKEERLPEIEEALIYHNIHLEDDEKEELVALTAEKIKSLNLEVLKGRTFDDALREYVPTYGSRVNRRPN